MSSEVRWSQDRNCYQLISSADATDEERRATWATHQRASVGEGHCPTCRARLEPFTSDEGPVQLCKRHGWWQVDNISERFSWWASHNPHDGSPAGPANVRPLGWDQ